MKKPRTTDIEWLKYRDGREGRFERNLRGKREGLATRKQVKAEREAWKKERRKGREIKG